MEALEFESTDWICINILYKKAIEKIPIMD